MRPDRARARERERISKTHDERNRDSWESPFNFYQARRSNDSR